MAGAGPAPPQSVVISVRLKDEAGAAMKVKFTQGDFAEDVKDGIRVALRLAEGIRFRLVDESGDVCVTNGNLPAGEYTVEPIRSDP